MSGGGERSWTCCREGLSVSGGCARGENHVFKVGDVKRLAGMWQWIRTYPELEPPEIELSPTQQKKKAGRKIARAFSLDCEMCYTTLGMELIRLTLVGFPNAKTVLDALVRPKGEILDLNTRYSGVGAREYINAKPYSRSLVVGDRTDGAVLGIFPSPEAAREEVISFLRGEAMPSQEMDSDRRGKEEEEGVSVLIGHALENDLNVLRICHEFIVDTCILFPHSRGFPVRNKLSWIAEKVLNWKIQADASIFPTQGVEGGEGGSVGHDSAIDARCAGELVRSRIKEVAKKEGAGVGGGRSKGGENKPLLAPGRIRGGNSGGAGGIKYDGVARFIQRERERQGQESVNAMGVDGKGTAKDTFNDALSKDLDRFRDKEKEKKQDTAGTGQAVGVGVGGGKQKRRRGVFCESDGEGELEG